MTRARFWSTVGFFLLCCLLLTHPARATTSCAYNFSYGTGNNLLKYCVTVNGNIPQIETASAIKFGINLIFNDEGYGICNESPPQNYTDYGADDTGNWDRAVLLSHTSTSVAIARTTSDSHWTLTQTITTTHVPSINVVMALKNNQSVQKTAYLTRFVVPGQTADNPGPNIIAGLNGVFGWAEYSSSSGFVPSLSLENVGTPPFGFWQAYAIALTSNFPNACAFAFYASSHGWVEGFGGMEVAYVGPVPAGATRSVTVTYRGL